MIGYDDRLDLLGVRFDAEMELLGMYELAEDIASYWKGRCSDEDFYENCIKDIKEELGERYPEDIRKVWKIIEENFM